MIAIISPAKSMDFNKRIITDEYSVPIFTDEAEELIEELRQYAPPELCRLMKISDKLSELNAVRFKKWEKHHDIYNAKAAISAYDGTVYKALKAEELNEKQLDFAQQHLRIVSGLYGVLRPLDIIQPYRLEMSIKLKNKNGKDLYEFWNDIITNYFYEEIKLHEDKTIVNLASNEYSSAIDYEKFSGKVINIAFKEYRKGSYKTIALNAKKARGLMTRFIIENYIDNVEELKNFDDKYSYNEGLSTDSNWVFTDVVF